MLIYYITLAVTYNFIIIGAENVFPEYYWRKPAESGRPLMQYERQIRAGSVFFLGWGGGGGEAGGGGECGKGGFTN